MNNKAINEWFLERYKLGELPNKQMKKLERQIKDNPEAETQLQKLKESDQEVLEKYPAGEIVPNILNRMAQDKKSKQSHEKRSGVWFRRLILVSPALVAVLLIAVILLPILKKWKPFSGPHTDLNQIRIKGSKKIPNLQIFRKKNNYVEQLKDGAISQEGDLLQISYFAAQQKHGIIFSIDGNGVVTQHFPQGTNESTELNQGRRIPLGSAYELDNAPGFERFIFITSQSPIDVVEILNKARKLAKKPQSAKTQKIDLPDSFHQASFIIIKGGKR